MPPRASLPKISVEDKAKIFPDVTNPIPKKWTDVVPAGVPLFWGETKSVALWKQLLLDVDAKLVNDLTPNLALATACMELGIYYIGLTSNQHQTAWLTNAIDRAAMVFVCKSGHHLYQEDLAVHVKEIFADLVESAEEQPKDDAIALTDDEADDK